MSNPNALDTLSKLTESELASLFAALQAQRAAQAATSAPSASAPSVPTPEVPAPAIDRAPVVPSTPVLTPFPIPTPPPITPSILGSSAQVSQGDGQGGETIKRRRDSDGKVSGTVVKKKSKAVVEDSNEDVVVVDTRRVVVEVPHQPELTERRRIRSVTCVRCAQNGWVCEEGAGPGRPCRKCVGDKKKCVGGNEDKGKGKAEVKKRPMPKKATSAATSSSSWMVDFEGSAHQLSNIFQPPPVPVTSTSQLGNNCQPARESAVISQLNSAVCKMLENVALRDEHEESRHMAWRKMAKEHWDWQKRALSGMMGELQEINRNLRAMRTERDDDDKGEDEEDAEGEEQD